MSPRSMHEGSMSVDVQAEWSDVTQELAVSKRQVSVAQDGFESIQTRQFENGRLCLLL